MTHVVVCTTWEEEKESRQNEAGLPASLSPGRFHIQWRVKSTGKPIHELYSIAITLCNKRFTFQKSSLTPQLRMKQPQKKYIILLSFLCLHMQTHVILFPFKSTNISETLPVGILDQTLHSKSVWSVSHQDWREICTGGGDWTGNPRVTLHLHSLLRLNRAACSTFFARQPLNNLGVGQITR